MNYNLHTHSTFCDGAGTPEQMVAAAIEKGFDTLGFSSHSDMVADLGAYKSEIRRLREKYAGRICILCGIEAEYDTGFARGDFDYVIGSTHYITAPDGARFAFDHTPQILADGIRDHFRGDSAAFVRAYYAQEREMVLEYDCDIKGANLPAFLSMVGTGDLTPEEAIAEIEADNAIDAQQKGIAGW